MKGFLVLILVFLTFPFIVLSESPDFEVHCVLDYGAVADGNTDDTHAFKKAWEWTCRSSNTAVMYVPANRTFLVEPLKFEGPCNSKNIRIEINGKIVAPKKPSEWKCEHNACNRWFDFDSVDGVLVHGSGTIDGQGRKWWSMLDKERPSAFYFKDCKNVRLSGLSFENNPHDHIVLHQSRDVEISNILIEAPGNSPNTDGINIGQSTNITIIDSKIGTGDDCISIVDGSSHLDIRNITCGPGHGISIGSLGKEGEYSTVEYVHVRDVVFRRTQNGARIKTWQEGRGYARHIIFERIVNEEANYPIIIDQFYVDNENKGKQPKGQGSAVHVSNVTYRDISGTSMRDTAVKLACSNEVPCKDIFMENINIARRNGDDASAYCDNVRGRARGEITPHVSCLKYT